MSVIEVLEKFDSKHTLGPEDDKAGWKRLIHGAMTKAAGLFWTTGGSMDLTLGPSNEENPRKFTEIRSPNDTYLSASLDSSDDNFQSIEDSGSVQVLSPWRKSSHAPQSHSTPYKVINTKSEEVKIGGSTAEEEPTKSSRDVPVPSTDYGPCISDLCSELERLSLKKFMLEVKKSLADDVKEEFDEKRKSLEEHDQLVEKKLEREKEERAKERELTEMNWFQSTRESQIQVEHTFNSNLDAILLKIRKKENKLQIPTNVPHTNSLDEAAKLDLVMKKRPLIDSIGCTQKNYNEKYNDLLQLLQSSRASLVTEFHSEFDILKKNNNLLTEIISKSKCGNISQDDVEQCNKLFESLCQVYDNIKKRNEEYENAKKLEEEANAKLAEALKKNEENAKLKILERTETTCEEELDSDKNVVIETSSVTNKRRLDRLKYYEYVNRMLKKAEKSLESFFNDDMYKNFRKDCQRAVNVPVNAISSLSAQHLQDKYTKLTDLLNGKWVPVMSRMFCAETHPMGVKYCEILLARKIVKVGEDVVSSHPETGHALASVVVCLIMRHPVLTVYLHAYLFRVCPYLVPLDLQPLQDESDDHYNKRLGFYYQGDEREDTDKFLKRMSGVAQLYGALLVANKRRSDASLTAPLGVSELWLWITNFISLEPLSDISATLLLDILEVSGHSMLSSYGYNFQKLLYLICTNYLVKINKVTTKGRGGPVERLKTFLEDVIKVKTIAPPKGLIPSHFW